MFDLFGDAGISDSKVVPMVPTGTLLDYMTGEFVPGMDGATICDGGLAPTNGTHGPPGTFKSTLTDGWMVNALERWPETRYLDYDTEQSKRNKDRLARMASLYRDDPEKRAAHVSDVENRIRVKNLTDYPYIEDFLEDIKTMYDAKMKNLKNWMVETPILDSRSGKPRRMILPTFICLDSLSKAVVKTVDQAMLKAGDTSGDSNMSAAREALMKNRILRRLPKMAETAGFCFFFTAQQADVMSTDGGPPKKVTQFMRQGEKVKGTGSDYMFLVQSDFEVRSPKLCLDGDKKCDYPYPSGITAPAEMSEVQFTVNRCKNHGAGLRFLPVVSQTNGYEPAVSDYNFLRKNGFFGLGTDRARPRPALMSDQFFMRTTAYEKLKDPKMARAIEILAQLYMVQTSWTIMDKVVPFDITPEQLAEFLNKSSYAMGDILASRGWWTYKGTKFDDQPYMSLYDILAIAAGAYKPKFWQVGSAKAETPVTKKAA